MDRSGIGDTSVQLTYLPADSRKQNYGFLLGAELSLPTGDKDSSLGSGTYDLLLRSTISKKTSAGFPYFAAIYTWTGVGSQDGYKTEKPDDLLLAVGFKSRTWHRLSLDARLFRYFLYGDQVSYNETGRVVSSAHDLPGCRLTMKYLFSKVLEGSVFFEKARPEDHLQNANGMLITKKPDSKNRFAIALRYLW